MSETLLTFLAENGGEHMNAPMQHSHEIDEVDILEFREDIHTGTIESRTLPGLKLTALRSLVDEKRDPDCGFVLRIACIPLLTEGTSCVIGLKKEYYDALLNKLNLQSLRNLAHTSPMTFDVHPQRADNQVTGVRYSAFVSKYIGLYFAYDHSGCAWGVTWCRGDKNPQRIQSLSILKAALQHFKHLAADPLYVMFCLVVCLLCSVDQRLTQVRDKVHMVEDHTGHRNWGHLEVLGDLFNPRFETHLSKDSIEMSGLATTLASDKRLIKLALKMLATIEEPMWRDNLVPTTTNHPLQNLAAKDLAFAEARLRNRFVLIDFLKERVRSQLSVVQNLIIRHEMHDSKTIANAMKVLAILTVLFLPGSFVASLLSTSMFDWHISDADFVSTKFWIYWAITVPLTLITVVVFFLLSRRWSRAGRMPDQEASRDVLEPKFQR